MSEAILEITNTIIRLEKELAEEMKNTARPGNPYIAGLQGRINGLKESLKLIKAAL